MRTLLVVFILCLAVQVEAREIFLMKRGNWQEFYQNRELAREFAQNKDKKLTGSILGIRGYAQVQLGSLICSGRFYITDDLWIVYLTSVIRFYPDGHIAFFWTSESGLIFAGG